MANSIHDSVKYPIFNDQESLWGIIQERKQDFISKCVEKGIPEDVAEYAIKYEFDRIKEIGIIGSYYLTYYVFSVIHVSIEDLAEAKSERQTALKYILGFIPNIDSYINVFVKNYEYYDFAFKNDPSNALFDGCNNAPNDRILQEVFEECENKYGWYKTQREDSIITEMPYDRFGELYSELNNKFSDYFLFAENSSVLIKNKYEERLQELRNRLANLEDDDSYDYDDSEDEEDNEDYNYNEVDDIKDDIRRLIEDYQSGGKSIASWCISNADIDVRLFVDEEIDRINARGSRSDIDNYIGDKREKNEECGAADNIKELLDKCNEIDTKLKDILIGDLERYAQLVSQDIERVKMDIGLISNCVDENMRNIDD